MYDQARHSASQNTPNLWGNTMRRHAWAIIASLFAPTSVYASDPQSTDHWAWSENAGWIDFCPANAGVRFLPQGLAGLAYGENIGWIDFGFSGFYPPAEQQEGPSLFGVRIEAAVGDGSIQPLSGYAWAENAGWINFNTWQLGVVDAMGDPAGVRIEGDRLRGYAWAENLGWINFDDPTRFVAVDQACSVADLSPPSGVLNFADVQTFLGAFGAGNAAADIAAPRGTLNFADIQAFLGQFGVGCP